MCMLERQNRGTLDFEVGAILFCGTDYCFLGGLGRGLLVVGDHRLGAVLRQRYRVRAPSRLQTRTTSP